MTTGVTFNQCADLKYNLLIYYLLVTVLYCKLSMFSMCSQKIGYIHIFDTIKISF